MIDTEILTADEAGLKRAAELLKKGGIVAMPTETVYGLAGNALDPHAAERIYCAKGRPSDNPLIVHLSDATQAVEYVKVIPETAKRIFSTFSPGPVTVVLPKKEIIPKATSGGLDTVGLRIPADKRARRLISLCGFPLAAPSANLSGSPSPTSANHVISDLFGAVDGIIDGGECGVGVESTVLSVDDDNNITILRPGFITAEDLREVSSPEKIHLAKGITERIGEEEKVLSPGMKYKHYAPKADIAIIDTNKAGFEQYISAHGNEKAYALCFGDENINIPMITLGVTSEEQAHNLFNALRRLDEVNAERVFARMPDKKGVGLAVYNRLLRAAGFEVIKP